MKLDRNTCEWSLLKRVGLAHQLCATCLDEIDNNCELYWSYDHVHDSSLAQVQVNTEQSGRIYDDFKCKYQLNGEKL